MNKQIMAIVAVCCAFFSSCNPCYPWTQVSPLAPGAAGSANTGLVPFNATQQNIIDQKADKSGVQAGPRITITGNGTASSPYIFSPTQQVKVSSSHPIGFDGIWIDTSQSPAIAKYNGGAGWVEISGGETFNQAGSYSPTGTWDFTGATLAGVPKTSDFVTFSASSPLSFNPSTGALSMVPHAYQAYDANMIAWPAAVSAAELTYAADGATSNLQAQINAISAGGFVPNYVSTDPTTASTAGLYVNITSGHMFVVGSTGIWDGAGTWTAATSGGHNWVTDTTLQALYLLNGSSEDAKNGQTLLCVNDPSCPTSDTTNKVEGSASISFTQSGTDLSYYLPQASLVTTFPANGPGDSAITVGGWIRTTTISADNKTAWNIHNGNTAGEIFGLDITSDNHLTLTADASGISTVNSDASLDNLSWYFHAATYDGTNTCLYVRKLGATTGSYTCITGATGGLDDMTTTGFFAIGGRYNGETSAAMFGNLDAIAVFTRAFNQTELDAVFAYGWEGAGW